mmetsp:Transcript_11559/g.27655  ORF Transcript_11559/g.27655 Transcript_11559/m.27655 type:complete len:782 (-) Transcript_11559:174-2519(-)
MIENAEETTAATSRADAAAAAVAAAVVGNKTALSRPLPPQREVARPVLNLGNTCYMNAVLQALSHAPELCHALDAVPHHLSCPIWKENEQKRMLFAAAASRSASAASSRSSSPDGFLYDSMHQMQQRTVMAPTRKSSRRTRSPTYGLGEDGEGGHGRSKSIDPYECKFCALCELERHMGRVYPSRQNSAGATSSGNSNGKAVAPTDFVNGFINHVAPHFKLGQQEDSHEFLRLLIDAMQKSCQKARGDLPETKSRSSSISSEQAAPAGAAAGASPSDPNRRTTRRQAAVAAAAAIQGNPQDTPPEPTSEDVSPDESDSSPARADVEVDVSGPLEDGEPTATGKVNDAPKDTEYPFQLFRGMIESKVTCGSCSATSCTTDPIEDLGLDITGPPNSHQLLDVQSAVERFAHVEELDSGYKCEKCGKVGRATKESRLTNIPPILTLQLKRFRYGENTSSTGQASSGGSGSTSSRRRNLSSELNQLMQGTNNGGADWFGAGKSGSAKIEGHSAFKPVIDLKPLFSQELKDKGTKTLARLFAVIVHVGQNSHSGHYLAYVASMKDSKEWWKMDDARVTKVPVSEVMNAEAYMLFYRAVDHPYSKQLEVQVKQLKDEHCNTLSKRPSSLAVIKPNLVPVEEEDEDDDGGPATRIKKNPRKRRAPDFTNGEEWKKKKGHIVISDDIVAKVNEIQEMVKDYLIFSPEFIQLLSEEATKYHSTGSEPNYGISMYDNVAECVEEDAKATILKCFFRMCTDTCLKKLRIEPNEEDGSADDHGPSRVHVVPQP